MNVFLSFPRVHEMTHRNDGEKKKNKTSTSEAQSRVSSENVPDIDKPSERARGSPSTVLLKYYPLAEVAKYFGR